MFQKAETLTLVDCSKRSKTSCLLWHLWASQSPRDLSFPFPLNTCVTPSEKASTWLASLLSRSSTFHRSLTQWVSLLCQLTSFHKNPGIFLFSLTAKPASHHPYLLDLLFGVALLSLLWPAVGYLTNK